MGSSELQIVNLSKTYRKGKIKANDNITVTLMPNEVTALIGHNGAGGHVKIRLS